MRLKKRLKINNLKYWLIAKIYNINNNIKVKVIVIFKDKIKSAKGLLIYLIVVIILYKMLNRFNFNFIVYLLKNLKQLVNG